MRRCLVAAATVSLLTACSGGSDYESPKALADALAEAGLDCKELREGPAGDGSQRSAECRTADGHDIGLQVHDEAEQASSLIASADSILDGTNRKAIVHEGRWIVYVDDEGTARRVQDAIGGEVTKVASQGG